MLVGRHARLVFPALALLLLVGIAQAAAGCGNKNEACNIYKTCCSSQLYCEYCSCPDGQPPVCSPECVCAAGVTPTCGPAGTCKPVSSPVAPVPSTTNWYDSVYLWTALAVALSAAFIGLAYMAGKLFEIQLLEGWVKLELQELMASIVIAVFCVALIASANGAAQFLSGETGATDVVDAARSFIKNGIYEDGRSLYRNLGLAYFNIARVASYSYSAGMTYGFVSASFSESPASGLAPLVSEVGQAMDSASNFMLLAASQSAFMAFFKSAALVMLPVGIFLRSFSLTRKIGGTILAAVIASSVIYPVGMLLSKEIYSTYQPDLQASTQGITKVAPAPNPPLANAVCNPLMTQFVMSPLPFVGGELGWYIVVCIPLCAILQCHAICYQILQWTFVIINSFFPIIMYLGILGPFASGINDFSGIQNAYYNPIRDYALPAVAKYGVLSLVVFLIPLIIAMVMLRNLAIAFGGEPQLYGMSKLI